MRHAVQTILVIVCLGIFFPTAQAQDALPDLSGQWTLQTTASFSTPAALAPSGENGPANCTFEGSAMVTQSDGSIMGPVSLQLTSGSPQCPKDMQADLSGDLQGSAFGGTLDGGNLFGMADFNGTLNSDSMTLSGQLSFSKTPAGPAAAAGGGFNVQPGGPFAGGMGNFTAQRLTAAPSEIPTLSGIGMALLAAVLLLSSLLVMRRTAS